MSEKRVSIFYFSVADENAPGHHSSATWTALHQLRLCVVQHHGQLPQLTPAYTVHEQPRSLSPLCAECYVTTRHHDHRP